jgi:hypothetical protein
VVRGDHDWACGHPPDDLDPVEKARQDVDEPADRGVEAYAQKRSSSAPTRSA